MRMDLPTAGRKSMTPEATLARLDEIEARCNAATKGAKSADVSVARHILVEKTNVNGERAAVWCVATPADKALLFNAPADIPDLLAYVRHLQATVAGLTERVTKYREKLEVDRHWEGKGTDGLHCVYLPFDQDEPYDGIDCRNETIKLQDERIREQAALLREAGEVLKRFGDCAYAWEDAADDACLDITPNYQDATAGDLRRAAAWVEKMERVG